MGPWRGATGILDSQDFEFISIDYRYLVHTALHTEDA